MIKTLQETYQYMLNQGEKILLEYKGSDNLSQYVYDKYNVPKGIIIDYLCGRIGLEGANEFILYTILDGLDYVRSEKSIENYFTKVEQKTYSKQKYKKQEISFPIKIKCMQVGYDQWIGISDIKFLMELRAAQLINYNTNAQRTMEKVIKGESEYYKITLNEGAIKSIRNLCHNKAYIPNTITLNIPDGDDNDWFYDEKTKELIINKLDYFDISDGYHRYIAFSRESDSDSSFNLPIELRIVNFPDDKVKQFIFQEDQKTQMKKIDSKSMNMNAPSNIVLERLNESFDFYYKGEISRNEGKINFSKLSLIVDYYYFKNNTENINQQIRDTVKQLKTGINDLSDVYPELFERELGLKELMFMVALINKKKGQIKCSREQLDKYLKNINTDKINKLFYNRTNVTSSLVKAIDQCIK